MRTGDQILQRYVGDVWQRSLLPLLGDASARQDQVSTRLSPHPDRTSPVGQRIAAPRPGLRLAAASGQARDLRDRNRSSTSNGRSGGTNRRFGNLSTLGWLQDPVFPDKVAELILACAQ